MSSDDVRLSQESLLEAARKGIQEYVEQFNEQQGSQVEVFLDLAGMCVDIDGGGRYGAYSLVLGDL
jgi:hypothetical protein